MIQQADRTVLNSIFMPKHLFAGHDVRFIVSEDDAVQMGDQLAISFMGPIEMDGCSCTAFNYISNPDGTIRWIFPANTRSPQFLEFYNTTSPRAKAFALAIKTASALFLGLPIM